MAILKIYDGNTAYALSKLTNWFILNKSDGTKTMEFDIDPRSELYPLICEETRLEYNNLYYNIKKINERKSTSTVTAELDLDDLKAKVWWQGFNYGSHSLTSLLNNILSETGWAHTGDDSVTCQRTVTLENDPGILDILDYTTNSTSYNVRYKFDNLNKVLLVTSADSYTESGVYFTDELNLKEPPEMKGSTENFYTRIYPFGQDDLNLATATSSKKYIDASELGEEYVYKDVCISYIWRDERYTNVENLRAAAIEKLKSACMPIRTYTCKVVDLAKANPDKYSFLNFDLHQIVTLIDRRRGLRMKYSITEYKEYPNNPMNNTVTLGNRIKTIRTVTQSINNSISNSNYILRQKANKVITEE